MTAAGVIKRVVERDLQEDKKNLEKAAPSVDIEAVADKPLRIR